MPPGCAWSEPTGGMFTWLRMPEHLDSIALRPAATEAGVAYVPGRPFYVTDDGAHEMRLSFSSLDEAQLAEAAKRLAGVIAERSARARVEPLPHPLDRRRHVRRVDVVGGVGLVVGDVDPGPLEQLVRAAGEARPP